MPGMLQAQLQAAQTSSEVAGYVQQMKAIMLGNGLQPGFRFYIAQLRAAVRMHDVQVRVWESRGQWPCIALCGAATHSFPATQINKGCLWLQMVCVGVG